MGQVQDEQSGIQTVTILYYNVELLGCLPMDSLPLCLQHLTGLFSLQEAANLQGVFTQQAKAKNSVVKQTLKDKAKRMKADVFFCSLNICL